MEDNKQTNEKLVLNQIKSCIVCKKGLTSVFSGSDTKETNYIQPDGGVSFNGSGGYGSSFDYSPDYVVNICDGCLKAAIEADEVLVHSKETTHSYKPAERY